MYDPKRQISASNEDRLSNRRISEESERCWIAIRYTKSWEAANTPALQDQIGIVAVKIEEKRDMVRRRYFPAPPKISKDHQSRPRV